MELTSFDQDPDTGYYEAILDHDGYSQIVQIHKIELETAQRHGETWVLNLVRDKIEEAKEVLLNRIANA